MKFDPLDIKSCIPQVERNFSTSGDLFYVSRYVNVVASFPKAATIRLGLENLSESPTVFRGQSSVTGNQFQLILGPNEIRDLFLPGDPEYTFSTDNKVKLSSISFVPVILLEEFDEIKTPNPSIQVKGLSLAADRSGEYLATGLANITFNLHFGREDYLLFSFSGNDEVVRLNNLRLRLRSPTIYFCRAERDLNVIALGGQNPYKFSTSFLQKKIINPAYVSPEASLWSFENEAL